MRRLLSTVFLILWLAAGYAANLPEGFTEQVILENIDPVSLAITPDGRVLVAEKNGIVRIIYEEVLQPAPFVRVNADNYNERGLQNIILDPDFDLNNYLYLFYTTTTGYNRVSRFTAGGNTVMPGSEVILFESSHIANGSIHNGGGMAINDGKLFIGFGESGYPERAADMNSTLGKIVRINLDGSIPEDNPFYNTLSGNNRAIYAYGFRNPFSIDQDLITGQIFVNDVGGSAYEEVNLLKPGKNYGWPAIEGYPQQWQTEPADHERPFFAYTHDLNGRCAIVGAAFYNPEKLHTFPQQYWEKYFFGDYCSGEMFYMNPTDGTVNTFGTNFNRLVAMKITSDGQMYYLQRAGIGDGSIGDNTTTNQGALILIRYNGSGAPFISRQPQNKTVAAGENAEFVVYGSGKSPLQYEWKVNGLIAGGDSSRLVLHNTDLSMNNAIITVTLRNDVDHAISTPAILTVVNNTRPVPLIELPTGLDNYSAGTIIHMKGSATDAEDGSLDAANLTWHIDFHHDRHTHPAMLPTSGYELTYEIPKIGETSDNVWYRIYLSATDSHGFTSTTYTDVFPKKSRFSIKAVPAGAPVKLEGHQIYQDTTITSVVGITRIINADRYSIMGDSIYTFLNWEIPQYRIPLRIFDVTEEEASFTAYFSVSPLGSGDGLNTYYYDTETKFDQHIPDISTKGNINFTWEDGKSPEGMPDNHFYARYTGWIQPVITDDYTFYTNSDDGVRLWINNTLLIDDWRDYSVRENSASMYLKADTLYPVTLEYYEGEGDAVIELHWSSDFLSKAIVPVRQLHSTRALVAIDITEQPQNQTLVIGENAEFTVKVTGISPLTYVWRMNNTIIGDNAATLIIPDIDLTMNNAKITVTVSNHVDTAVSLEASLIVVDNIRPTPYIELPTGTDKYNAGEEIRLKGSAADAEDGVLNSENLSWRIDFHQEGSAYTVMQPVSGSEHTFTIPQTGEPSADVWYRIYLTATDSDGFSQSIYTDLYPNKTRFMIRTIPQGSPIRIENREIFQDTTVTSVAGMTRTINVNKNTIKGDYLYTFLNWGNPETDMLSYTFDAKDKDTTFTAYFKIKPIGDGNGLNTYYYNSEYKFDQHIPDIITLGNVNYNWGLRSPDGMPNNYFFARFEGWIRPIYTGEHTFYTASDDGVRLSVNYEELIDDWRDNAVRENTGTIYLEEDVNYPITLEYYEAEGDAVIELYWSAEYLPKAIVPVRQLYSTDVVTSLITDATASLNLYPNPCGDILHIKEADTKWDKITIKNYAGITVAEYNGNELTAPLNVSYLHTGFYIVEARNDSGTARRKIFKK